MKTLSWQKIEVGCRGQRRRPSLCYYVPDEWGDRRELVWFKEVWKIVTDAGFASYENEIEYNEVLLRLVTISELYWDCYNRTYDYEDTKHDTLTEYFFEGGLTYECLYNTHANKWGIEVSIDSADNPEWRQIEIEDLIIDEIPLELATIRKEIVGVLSNYYGDLMNIALRILSTFRKDWKNASTNDRENYYLVESEYFWAWVSDGMYRI